MNRPWLLEKDKAKLEKKKDLMNDLDRRADKTYLANITGEMSTLFQQPHTVTIQNPQKTWRI